MNTLKKVFTVFLLTVILAGNANAAKWKELVFSDDVNLGMAELTQYCMLHDITVADVLWANSVESADIKAGQSLYLPANHADMLAIWQHKGAWQPTALVPVTSAAAAKRAVKSDPKPAEVPAPKAEAPAPKVEEAPAIAETSAVTEPQKSNDDIMAQLREEVKVEAINFPPEVKAEAETPKVAETPATQVQPVKAETPAPTVQTAKAASVPTQIPQVKAEPLQPVKTAKAAKSSKNKKETPAKVIANTAKPDKILTSKSKKSAKQEIPGLMDPIIVLSPNGDPSKGPMRLVISGDKVEVVQLPKSAAPKRPSLSDLDHTFGTNPSYLPHYNMTPKPRDPFVLNMGNLAGKMLWPVDVARKPQASGYRHSNASRYSHQSRPQWCSLEDGQQLNSGLQGLRELHDNGSRGRIADVLRALPKPCCRSGSEGYAGTGHRLRWKHRAFNGKSPAL